MRNRILLGVWGILLAALVGGDAAAQTLPDYTVWKAELDTKGDWSDAELWTNGLPTAEVEVKHVNGSELLLTTGAAESLNFELSHSRGGLSLFTQTGGSLSVAETVRLTDGIYRHKGGELNASALQLGSTGEFQLVVNFLDLTDVPLPEDICTPGIVDNVLNICPLGPPTQREFHLEDGRIDIQGEVRVGQAQLRITHGELNAGSMFIDSATLRGLESEAVQTGGAVSMRGDLKIQDGTYELAGGSLTIDRLVMGDPNEQQWLISFGSRTPAFRQTGGTMQVRSNLELCQPGFIPWNPTDIDPFTDITYYLDAGALDVAGDTVVGSLGVAPARFFQTGGAHTTAGTLRIEGESSIYRLSGGELRVGKLHVGTAEFNEGGTFAVQTASAEIHVAAGITLGLLARVEAAPGAAIHLHGGDVEILGSDASLLAGLENLSLLVETEGAIATLEVAGADLGNVAAGFAGNFTWDTLEIGGETTGHLSLVDLTANQSGGLPEAIYVDRLFVGAGSTLDLGDLNIYYREAIIAGQILSAGGAMQAVVPEPSTAALLAAAVIRPWIRRGWRRT